MNNISPLTSYMRKGISMSATKIFIIALISMGLWGCIVKPNFVESYDHQCRTIKKKVTLTVEEMTSIGEVDCDGNSDCKDEFIGQIIGSSLLLPISAIISGSIALVGNTVYWLQQDKC